MPEKDELDRYAIPKALRAKIFQVSLAGLAATCGIMFWLLQQCNKGWREDTERFMNKALELSDKRANQVMNQKIQQADNQFQQKTDSVTYEIDSLSRELELLKKQRQ